MSAPATRFIARVPPNFLFLFLVTRSERRVWRSQVLPTAAPATTTSTPRDMCRIHGLLRGLHLFYSIRDPFFRVSPCRTLRLYHGYGSIHRIAILKKPSDGYVDPNKTNLPHLYVLMRWGKWTLTHRFTENLLMKSDESVQTTPIR